MVKKASLGILTAVAVFFLSVQAEAATCFWVGGTGTWSTSNTASWASSSGGTGGTCAATGGVPKQAADTATWDASSGGGTVTVDSTINGISLTAINAGAFTGTLDFSVNNPSISHSGTISFSGTGTRTITLGSSVFSCTSSNALCFDNSVPTNETLSATSATFNFTASGSGQQTANFGGRAYGTIVIGAHSGGGAVSLSNAGGSFASVSIAGPVTVYFPGGTTTITNALNWNPSGSSSAFAVVRTNGSTATISLSASGSVINYSVLGNIAFTTNTATATNSFDLGGNSGVTITNPPAGSGSRIIGG